MTLLYSNNKLAMDHEMFRCHWQGVILVNFEVEEGTDGRIAGYYRQTINEVWVGPRAGWELLLPDPLRNID